MLHQERLNIAVFIDFDNIEIGVKTTLNEHFDIDTILDAIKERGEVVTKIAYADWTRAGEHSRTLTQHAIRLVQRNLTPGGDKNGADINLALDALEMAFTHPHINAYVIVGGDSDFLSLVEKLKQYDKKVFVVGGRAFTSVILQRNCHEFIAYENLTGGRKAAAIKGGRPAAATAASPIAQALPIVRRALKILADREVSPQTGLLKSTLLQLDSTFSERNYGASSFLDFAEKLARSGFVRLKHSGRSVMVELNEGVEDGGGQAGAPAPAPPARVAVEPARAPQAEEPTQAPQSAEPVPLEPRPAGDPAEGVRITARSLAAATSARWPMYLRNVKQILRAADGSFDERRYGFGGLIDLLRACQRDGIVRLERDRRGGLRVFQGPAFQPAATPLPPEEEQPQPVEAVAGEAFEQIAAAIDVTEPAPSVPEPTPIDTTGELLGTARSKRPSRRAAQARPRSAPRKTSVRKAAAPRRSTRQKKGAASDAKDDVDQS